jgi:hypothetical protein
MTTPVSSADESASTKRPFGIVVVESYFVTFLAFSTFKLIADLDFFTRRKAMLHLRFLDYFVDRTKISELVVGVLCVLTVIGLQRMQLWARWLAIVLAGASVGYAIWFYSAVVIFRLWTLVPHKLWPYLRSLVELGFGVYIIWYLLLPEARHAFRPSERFSPSKGDTNS